MEDKGKANAAPKFPDRVVPCYNFMPRGKGNIGLKEPLTEPGKQKSQVICPCFSTRPTT